MCFYLWICAVYQVAFHGFIMPLSKILWDCLAVRTHAKNQSNLYKPLGSVRVINSAWLQHTAVTEKMDRAGKADCILVLGTP